MPLLKKVNSKTQKIIDAIKKIANKQYSQAKSDDSDLAPLIEGALGWTVETKGSTARNITNGDHKTIFRMVDGSQQMFYLNSSLNIGVEFMIISDEADGSGVFTLQTYQQDIVGVIGESSFAVGGGLSIQLTNATSVRGNFLHCIVTSEDTISIVGGSGIYASVI